MLQNKRNFAFPIRTFLVAFCKLGVVVRQPKKPNPSRPAHFLRQWREHRRMTQEDLAGMIGTNASVISLLEDGKRRLSDKWLDRLAPALKTSRGAILDYDPNSVSNTILEIWASIPESSKPQALDILQTFRKKTA
jgi:transcriptional regulator with XRE-family HTH domain